MDLETYRVGPTPSVFYVPDFLSAQQQERLMTKIYGSQQWTELGALAGRRLQQHGGQPDPKGMLATALPDWLADLAEDLRARNFVPDLPNHVLINEYQPGQGILAHEDGPLYTPHFAIISLASSLLLHFSTKRTDTAPPTRIFSLLLQPGSLLVVAGEAYTDLLHGIDAVTEEPIDRTVINAPPELVGTTLRRERERVSLTIRHVVKVRDASRLFRLGGK